MSFQIPHHSGKPGLALDTALYSCEPCREYSQLPYSYDVCTDTSVERTSPAGFQSIFCIVVERLPHRFPVSTRLLFMGEE